MPSASSKSSQPQTPVNHDLMQEPLKNAVSVLDKKLRNLEKRKLKLLETRKKADIGCELNQDQKVALENLALVDNSVATVKELQKNIVTLDQEFAKLVRKEQKRIKQEKKDHVDTQSLDLSFKIVEVQGVLGDLSEEVRPDFLEGSNGACKLTEDDLANLDAFYELVNPAVVEGGEKKLSFRVKVAADHLISLVQGKDKPAVEDVTYKTLLDIMDRIIDSGYFDKDNTSEEQAAPEITESAVSEEEAPESLETPPDSPENEAPAEDFPQTDSTEQVSTPEEEEEPNGVDLPPEVQQTPDDEKIDFLGESEISTQASTDQNPPSLNPVSPEFVPRTQQQSSEEASGWDTGSNQQASQNTEVTNSDGWQSVPDNQGNNQSGGSRGRGGRGRGGRGRGRGSGEGYRGRQDGNYRGNYRGGNRGDYRGGRGSGEHRGGGSGEYRGGGSGEYRGGRGGPRGGRGGPRGGGSRGGFGKPQEQQ